MPAMVSVIHQTSSLNLLDDAAIVGCKNQGRQEITVPGHRDRAWVGTGSETVQTPRSASTIKGSDEAQCVPIEVERLLESGS